MKFIYLVLIFSLIVYSCNGLQDLLNSDFYKCVQCLCHSVSGCYKRENCAKYSISKEYWREAGSPRLLQHDDPNSNKTYNKCMQNENCIVHTIKEYTDKNLKDCNCDGKMDCKDRLSIHLSMGLKHDCINPYFGALKADRFNDCAKMNNIEVELMEIEEAECDVL